MKNIPSLIMHSSVYHSLLNESLPVPPETGGIIGKPMDSDIVTSFAFDHSILHDSFYEPNVEYLNSIISKWAENSIEFIGLFHSHRENWVGLSNGDMKYIKLIMENYCGSVLYFPLVFPKKKIDGFCAYYNDSGELCISSCNLSIVDD